MNLTAHLGDTKTFSIPLRWQNRPFTPGLVWHLVFTAKFLPTDDDAAAAFQLELGNGVTATGNYARVTMARSHTMDLDPTALYWDVQAENLDSDDVRTVALGRLHLLQEVTHTRKSAIGVNRNHLRDEHGTIILDDASSPILYV